MATTENTQILGQQSGLKILDRETVFSASNRILFAALIVYCAIGAGVVAISSARMLTNRWDNTYPEGAHVYAAIRAARTGHLYAPFTQPPNIVQSYGPLFYAINAGIARASHLDVWLTVLHGRLFCFLCYLLCSVFVYAISKKTGTTTGLSVLASLMMLAQPDFTYWDITVRPDVPFLLAMLVSLYFAVRDDSDGLKSIAISGFFTALAFLIKQPGMAAGITIFGVLAWNKQYRKAITFAVSAAVPVVMAVGLLLWRETYFLGQFTSVGKAIWSLSDGVLFLLRSFVFNGGALTRIVPVSIGIIGLRKAASQSGGRQMLFWFAVVNWLVGFSGLPQLGSTPNYFLPGLTAFALLLPAAVEYAREHARFTASAPRFAVAMLTASALLLLTTWLGYTVCTLTGAFFRAPGVVSYEPLRPYRIISDRSLAALWGHDPGLLDSFAVHSLELNNQWSSAPLVTELNDQKYDLILMLRVNYHRIAPAYRGISDFPPEVVTTINDKYVVLCNTFSAMILKPRDRDIPLSPEYFGQMLGAPCGTGSRNKPPRMVIDMYSR